jgi:hypothetical protein
MLCVNEKVTNYQVYKVVKVHRKCIFLLNLRAVGTVDQTEDQECNRQQTQNGLVLVEAGG